MRMILREGEFLPDDGNYILGDMIAHDVREREVIFVTGSSWTGLAAGIEDAISRARRAGGEKGQVESVTPGEYGQEIWTPEMAREELDGPWPKGASLPAYAQHGGSAAYAWATCPVRARNGLRMERLEEMLKLASPTY